MDEREKIEAALKQGSKAFSVYFRSELRKALDSGKGRFGTKDTKKTVVDFITDALIAANIGDVTEWKERAERMHKEALKQKQLISDSKHSEDTLRNQLKCALDMVSRMEHAKRTLEILYMSGAITEEALRDAVKQAKLEIEEEEADDR